MVTNASKDKEIDRLTSLTGNVKQLEDRVLEEANERALLETECTALSERLAAALESSSANNSTSSGADPDHHVVGQVPPAPGGDAASSSSRCSNEEIDELRKVRQ